MLYTQPLGPELPDDADEFGAKATSLGRLARLGVAVPGGLVISRRSFADALYGPDFSRLLIEANKLSNADTASLEDISSKLIKLVNQAPLPPSLINELFAMLQDEPDAGYAVRSSATVEDGHCHSWAGQLESVLDVRRSGFISAIRRCWASRFSPHALSYALIHSQPIEADVAVIVQRMVNATAAGVVLTVDPLDHTRQYLIIEATSGPGQRLVQGEVIPHRWKIERLTRTSEATPGAEELLSPETLRQLTDSALSIEEHWGHPCDIEWVLSDNLWFVQCRPMTGQGTPPAHEWTFAAGV